MNSNTTETNKPSENGQTKVICSTDLLNALEEMMRCDENDPVQWANIFSSRRKVINAYKSLRASNERDK